MATEPMNTGKPFFGYFTSKTNYNNRGTNVDTSAICFVADEHAIYNRGTRFTGYDASGNDIRTTYVKTVTPNGSYLKIIKGDDSSSNITVPYATSANKANELATEEGTSNQDRCVWFSNTSGNTKVVYDNDFKYNPSTNLLKVGQIKLNATATAGCTMQYDSTNECISFVFS